MAKDYILHDVSATQDSKIERLIDEYGVEGYGFYWLMLESLFQNNGYVPISYSKTIARKGNISKSKAETLMDGLVDVGLIDCDVDRYFSKRLLEQISNVTQKRDKYSKAQKKRYAKKSDKNPSQNKDKSESDLRQICDKSDLTTTITSTDSNSSSYNPTTITSDRNSSPSVNQETGRIQIGKPTEDTTDEDKFMTDEEMESFMRKLHITATGGNE